MPSPVPTIRPASLQDAASLAELVNMAGEGLPFYFWSKLAQRGEDPWSVGRARARREVGNFSYRNATVIEEGGSVAAVLIGYPFTDALRPVDTASMPAMLAPLQQLGNLVPGTWRVMFLASYPRYQNLGFGAALLRHAERLGDAANVRNGMSVIVADHNVGARRLYERLGYRQIADRPMVKETWQSGGSTWLLLAKPAPRHAMTNHAPDMIERPRSAQGRPWIRF